MFDDTGLGSVGINGVDKDAFIASMNTTVNGSVQLITALEMTA